MQYTAIIVDDEQNNRENLAHLLVKHCPQVEVMAEAASAAEALPKIQELKPEVIFLDIEMPHGNGFSLLEKLGDIDSQIIFVTAYDSYALNAIKFNALDYILKPIDPEELVLAVNKLEKRPPGNRPSVHNLISFVNGENKRLALSLTDEIRLAELSDIIRLEADNNYCRFIFKNDDSVLVSRHLGYYYELLKNEGFMRVHQSHLINPVYIKKYMKKDGGYLVMENDHEVPVSRTQRAHVLKLFSNI